MQPFLYTYMQEHIKADIQSIVEELERMSQDADTFYQHIADKTLDQYYSSVLERVASDLLTLPVERQYLGLEINQEEDTEAVADAVMEIALLLSSWFLKDASIVERDLARIITNIPAEDIRESRFLKRNNLLH